MKCLRPLLFFLLLVSNSLVVPAFASASESKENKKNQIILKTPLTEVSQKTTVKSSVKTLELKTSVKVTKNKLPKAKVYPSMLVPPPPPSIPQSGLGQGPVMMAGEMIDFMSKAELLELQSKLDTQLTHERKRLLEMREDSLDKQKRAQSFAELFSEGVVSRRELEAAQKDASKEEDNLPEAQDRVKDLEQRFAAVNKRLKELEAKKAKSSLSKKSSKAK